VRKWANGRWVGGGRSWFIAHRSAIYPFPRLSLTIPYSSDRSTWFLYNRLPFRAGLTHRPDDGGSTDLWNVDRHRFNYTAVYPIRLWTSYSLPWAPEISQLLTCLPERSGSRQYCLAVLSAETSLAAASTVWRSCQQRHLWQPPVLSGGPVSRDISGSHQYCLAVLSAETFWQPPVLSGGSVRRDLWQPLVLSGSPVSRDISGSHQYCLAVLSADTSLAATSTVWRFCQQRHLWQPPVLSGGPVSRGISGRHQYCLAVLSAETSLAATSTVWRSCQQRSLAATSTVWRFCQQRHLWQPPVVWRFCQQRHLWQPPVLSGGFVIRDISGSHQYCLAVLSAETSLAAASTVWLFCQQRHLWQPPVLSGGSVSRHLCQPPVLSGGPVSRDLWQPPVLSMPGVSHCSVYSAHNLNTI
jgi:hypothetical protein